MKKLSFLGWIVGAFLILALLAASLWSQLNPTTALLAVVLSFVFPLVAMTYYRFLVKRGEEGTPSRMHEFDFYANRRASDSASKESDGAMAKQLDMRYSEEYSVRAYSMCVIPAVAVSVIGWVLLLDVINIPRTSLSVAPSNSLSNAPTDASGTGRPKEKGKTKDDDKTSVISVYPKPIVRQAMGIGFLGSLLFCMQLLWQRLTTFDLKPTIFLRCAISLFSGLTFCYVVFSASEDFVDGFRNVKPGGAAESMAGNGAIVGYIVAFSLGYFPSLAIRWFTRVANSALGEPSRRSDIQSLSTVDGITIFHQERLLEEGIHTQHDLAFADVGDLLVKTPYNAGQLLDWVDQCALLLFVDPTEAENFRRGGVRNRGEFLTFWGNHYDRNLNADRSKPALLLQAMPERLDVVYDGLRRGTPNAG